MQIAGIQKTTMLDYPWKVATTIFTAGCNFRCPFCHNAEQVLPELIAKESSHHIPEEAFFNFLEKRKNVLDGVVLCGWEPTLQPDIVPFARKIKEIGLLVKLDTNGHAVEVVKEMIDENLIDYVSMDVKNTKEKYSKTSWVELTEKYFSSYNQMLVLLKDSWIDYELRTTVIKGYHTAEDIETITKSIAWVPRYSIQNFKSGKTLDPNFQWESFSQRELDKLKDIAEKHIEKVIIRN